MLGGCLWYLRKFETQVPFRNREGAQPAAHLELNKLVARAVENVGRDVVARVPPLKAP